MIATAKLSARHKLSIPKAICEAQHWTPGVELSLIPRGSGVLLIAVPSREQLTGIASSASVAGYRDRTARF